jgi:hypothetical protein
MLHSVGALMDTSFLRAAVADANEPARGSATPVSVPVSRASRWLHRVLGRRPGAAR